MHSSIAGRPAYTFSLIYLGLSFSTWQRNNTDYKDGLSCLHYQESAHITRHVRKTRTFFSKYADHVIAKYAAKICGNRPRLHIRVNLTWYIFGGDGIAQLLFSKFTAYQNLECTCIGLIGSKLCCFSDMPIQLAAKNRLRHRPPCSLNNEYWLSVYQITTKNIYCRQKCQHMRKNMRYAHFAKICEKCGKVPNMRQSHICVFLTCLI